MAIPGGPIRGFSMVLLFRLTYTAFPEGHQAVFAEGDLNKFPSFAAGR